MAEGVGFEPTVSCPTFDFESSALNRAQPPFRFIFNFLHSFRKLEGVIYTVHHYGLNELPTTLSTGKPKQLDWTPIENVKFLYQHKNRCHHVRSYTGSKPKWIPLGTRIGKAGHS
jgi:hypothetical protein